MLASPSKNRTLVLRKWQKHLLSFIVLLSMAGAVSIIWTLAEPKEQPVWLTGATPSVTSKGAAATSVASSTSGPASSGLGQTSSAAAFQTNPGSISSGTAKAPKASAEDDIPIYLIGAVKNPGIYIVRKGVYLYELLEMAGGLSADAAASSINLAMRITENQMVRIPTQMESEANDDPGVIVSGLSSSGSININTATQVMLEELPGVGPATAAAIIADRSKNGPFRRPEDLMRVPGIKESRYVLLEALITVG